MLIELCFSSADRMPSAEAKLLKLTHKSRKAKKKLTRIGQQAARSMDAGVMIREASETAGGERTPKRPRGGDVLDLTESTADRGFILPPCVADPRFLSSV